MLKKNESKHIFIPIGEGLPQQFFNNQIVSEWLTCTQASAYLGVTENALRIMVCRGQVKYHKMGRRLRFRLNDLSDLLTEEGVKR